MPHLVFKIIYLCTNLLNQAPTDGHQATFNFFIIKVIRLHEDLILKSLSAYDYYLRMDF